MSMVWIIEEGVPSIPSSLLDWPSLCALGLFCLVSYLAKLKNNGMFEVD
jgi:hypothetical protein